MDARLLSAKQAHSAECRRNIDRQRVLGAGVEKFTILTHRTIRSAGSSETRHGHFTPGQFAAPSEWQCRPELDGDDAERHAICPTYFASEAGPDEPSDQVGDRAFHAYISLIKLRRLIRNAPDFRTRMKLQQLQNNPATKLHHARVDAKTGQAARRPLKGERMSRSSSPGSVPRRSRDNPRYFFSASR